jgi:hypothetical protein
MLRTFIDTIPSQYYSDAELHMKKDSGRLDKDVVSFKAKIVEVNNKIDDLNNEISTRINQIFNESGIDTDEGKDKTEMEILNPWIRHCIEQCIDSEDLYQTAKGLPGDLNATGMKEELKQVISNVIHDMSILGKLSEWKDFETDLELLISNIREKSNPISMAIRNMHYNIRADCCPTYWGLIKRFI